MLVNTALQQALAANAHARQTPTENSNAKDNSAQTQQASPANSFVSAEDTQPRLLQSAERSQASAGNPSAQPTADGAPRELAAETFPTRQTSATAVGVVQVGDNQMSCEQLAGEINRLDQYTSSYFAVASAGDVTPQPRNSPLDAGNSAFSSLLGVAHPIIGMVANSVMEEAVSIAGGPSTGDLDPDMQAAYAAARRQSHLIRIFNNKGC